MAAVLPIVKFRAGGTSVESLSQHQSKESPWRWLFRLVLIGIEPPIFCEAKWGSCSEVYAQMLASSID